MNPFTFDIVNKLTGRSRKLTIKAYNQKHAFNKVNYYLKENEYIKY